MTVHASCVAVRGRGLLLLGGSGSGKSDLALRLIDRGACLVADDRVLLRRDGDRLLASPPAAIAGRLEVRGLGLLTLPWMADVAVTLALLLGARPQRLPPADRWEDPAAAGLEIPSLAFDPFNASAALRAEAALTLAARGGLGDHDA